MVFSLRQRQKVGLEGGFGLLERKHCRCRRAGRERRAGPGRPQEAPSRGGKVSTPAGSGPAPRSHSGLRAPGHTAAAPAGGGVGGPSAPSFPKGGVSRPCRPGLGLPQPLMEPPAAPSASPRGRPPAGPAALYRRRRAGGGGSGGLQAEAGSAGAAMLGERGGGRSGLRTAARRAQAAAVRRGRQPAQQPSN